MKESQPIATAKETGSPGIRFSPQLLAMIAVTLLALAIPLTILSIGIVKATRQPASGRSVAPAAEVPGLRSILERVADDKLAPAGLSDGRGQIVFVEGRENWSRTLQGLQGAAAALGCTVIPGEKGEFTGILVQVPAEAANRFHAALAKNARVESEPVGTGRMVIYQVRFQESP